MRARSVWRGRRPSQKVTVRSISRKPGQGAGVKTIFAPWESHPDFGLFGSAGPSPTTFRPNEGRVDVTKVIPAGDWYPIMDTKSGLINDCHMECVIQYEGLSAGYGTYMMAKGIDTNNFVGTTSYNNKIMLYERVGGAWGNLGVEMPVAGTRGKLLEMDIAGNQVTLTVDGVVIGTAATGLTGSAYMGSLIRDHPITGVMWTDMSWQGLTASVLDIDHDGLPDEAVVSTASGKPVVTVDDDSVNIDIDGDGNADIVIPK